MHETTIWLHCAGLFFAEIIGSEVGAVFAPDSLFAHVLIGKPVPTFPGPALANPTC
jgi:hypothetical protein